jgi:FMN phosphatase YigB (HAD superfamily)
MVHIGDNYEKDIVGAMTANINYIWLNHNNEHKKDVDKKNIIKSFLQVPEALKNIG